MVIPPPSALAGAAKAGAGKAGASALLKKKLVGAAAKGVKALTKSPFKTKREKNMAEAKKSAKSAAESIAEASKSIAESRKKSKAKAQARRKSDKLDIGRDRIDRSGPKRGFSG